MNLPIAILGLIGLVLFAASVGCAVMWRFATITFKIPATRKDAMIAGFVILVCAVSAALFLGFYWFLCKGAPAIDAWLSRNW